MLSEEKGRVDLSKLSKIQIAYLNHNLFGFNDDHRMLKALLRNGINGMMLCNCETEDQLLTSHIGVRRLDHAHALLEAIQRWKIEGIDTPEFTVDKDTEGKIASYLGIGAPSSSSTYWKFASSIIRQSHMGPEERAQRHVEYR